MTTSSADQAADTGLPRPSFERLLVVVTGSVSATDVPFALTYLRHSRPEVQLRVVFTPSANRFVTSTALQHRSGGMVQEDVWTDESGPLHVELARWADAVLVYPATLDYLSRVACGRGDSPSVLAIQCTRAPVVLAPGLPPGGMESPAYRRHWETLRRWQRFAIVPPVDSVSVFSGEVERAGAGTIADALSLLDSLWEATRVDDR